MKKLNTRAWRFLSALLLFVPWLAQSAQAETVTGSATIDGKEWKASVDYTVEGTTLTCDYTVTPPEGVDAATTPLETWFIIGTTGDSAHQHTYTGHMEKTGLTPDTNYTVHFVWGSGAAPFGGIFTHTNFDIKTGGTAVEPVDPTAIPAPPVPTISASDVKSIFSNTYEPHTTFTIGQWGQSTESSEVTVADDKKAWQFTKLNYVGFSLNGDNNVDFSGMKTIHLDLYPVGSNLTINIYPIWHLEAGGKTEKYVTKTLTKDTWNSIEIPVSDYEGLADNLTRIFQFKLGEANGAKTLYMGNFYLSGEEAAAEPEITYSYEATPTAADTSVSFAYTIYKQVDGGEKVAAAENDGIFKVFYAWGNNDAAQEAKALTTPTGTFVCDGLVPGTAYDFYPKFFVNGTQISQGAVNVTTTGEKQGYFVKIDTENLVWNLDNGTVDVPYTIHYPYLNSEAIANDALSAAHIWFDYIGGTAATLEAAAGTTAVGTVKMPLVKENDVWKTNYTLWLKGWVTPVGGNQTDLANVNSTINIKKQGQATYSYVLTPTSELNQVAFNYVINKTVDGVTAVAPVDDGPFEVYFTWPTDNKSTVDTSPTGAVFCKNLASGTEYEFTPFVTVKGVRIDPTDPVKVATKSNSVYYVYVNPANLEWNAETGIVTVPYEIREGAYDGPVATGLTAYNVWFDYSGGDTNALNPETANNPAIGGTTATGPYYLQLVKGADGNYPESIHVWYKGWVKNAAGEQKAFKSNENQADWTKLSDASWSVTVNQSVEKNQVAFNYTFMLNNAAASADAASYKAYYIMNEGTEGAVTSTEYTANSGAVIFSNLEKNTQYTFTPYFFVNDTRIDPQAPFTVTTKDDEKTVVPDADKPQLGYGDAPYTFTLYKETAEAAAGTLQFAGAYTNTADIPVKKLVFAACVNPDNFTAEVAATIRKWDFNTDVCLGYIEVDPADDLSKIEMTVSNLINKDGGIITPFYMKSAVILADNYVYNNSQKYETLGAPFVGIAEHTVIGSMPADDPVVDVIRDGLNIPPVTINAENGTFSADGNTFMPNKPEENGTIYWENLVKGGVTTATGAEVTGDQFLNLNMYYWVEYLQSGKMLFTFTYVDTDNGYLPIALVPAIHFFKSQDDQGNWIPENETMVENIDNNTLRCPASFYIPEATQAPRKAVSTDADEIKTAMTNLGYKTIRMRTTEPVSSKTMYFRFNMQYNGGGKVESSVVTINDIPLAVQTIFGDEDVDADAPAMFFNMQGVRVAADRLQPGIYIVVRGNKTKKILVK